MRIWPSSPAGCYSKFSQSSSIPHPNRRSIGKTVNDPTSPQSPQPCCPTRKVGARKTARWFNSGSTRGCGRPQSGAVGFRLNLRHLAYPLEPRKSPFFTFFESSHWIMSKILKYCFRYIEGTRAISRVIHAIRRANPRVCQAAHSE